MKHIVHSHDHVYTQTQAHIWWYMIKSATYKSKINEKLSLIISVIKDKIGWWWNQTVS